MLHNLQFWGYLEPNEIPWILNASSLSSANEAIIITALYIRWEEPNFPNNILIGPSVWVCNTGSAIEDSIYKCLALTLRYFNTSSWRLLLQTEVQITDFKIEGGICI